MERSSLTNSDYLLAIFAAIGSLLLGALVGICLVRSEPGNVGPLLTVGVLLAVPVLVSWFQVFQQVRPMRSAAGHPGGELTCSGRVDRGRRLVAENDQLREALREARTASARALAASEARTQFLAHMSHEIRTPLTAILGYVELLADGCEARCPYGEENARAHIATIASNAEHLLHVINDILDFSKVEVGKLEVECAPCSPATVISEAVELMRVRALAKKLKLTVDFSSPIPEQIQSDPVRLRQILLNLVSNAVKFTPHGSVSVAVSVREMTTSGNAVAARGPRLVIEVRDTGIGIDPADVSNIFEPFQQADRSTTRCYGGTGLGLAISRRLARALGGDIEVESEAGRGSTFRLTIPTGPLEGVALVRDARPMPVRLTRILRGADVPTPRLDGQVLLAEDGADNRRLIEFVLRKSGLQVTPVENGAQALEAAVRAWQAGEPFDVILMDVQMPELDGLSATRHLRAAGYGGAIIALTAHAMSADRERCLAAGCDEFAIKPIDRIALLATIQQLLTREPCPVTTA